eukprot:Polyplicarium_translucidae@DN1256_c0_g1_i4.p1
MECEAQSPCPTLVEEVSTRQRIVEVPEVHLTERIQRIVNVQEVIRRVPRIELAVEEKIVEVPQIAVVENVVKVPHVNEIVTHVPKLHSVETRRVVPRIDVQVVERFVEVPEVHYLDDFVEVPVVQPLIEHRRERRVVDIPVDVTKIVPRIEVRTILQQRQVPGPVEVVQVPIDVPVSKPVVQLVEKLVDVAVPHDVDVEVNVPCPVSAPPIPVHYEVLRPVEHRVPIDVPRRRVKHVPVDVDSVVEIPTPEYHDVPRVVRREVFVPVERVIEVEIPEEVEEIVEVPEIHYYALPPQVLEPRVLTSLKPLPTVRETRSPARVVVQPPLYLPTLYKTAGDPLFIDDQCCTPEAYSFPQSAGPVHDQLPPAAPQTPYASQTPGGAGGALWFPHPGAVPNGRRTTQGPSFLVHKSDPVRAGTNSVPPRVPFPLRVPNCVEPGVPNCAPRWPQSSQPVWRHSRPLG